MRPKKLLHNLFATASLNIDNRISCTLFDAVEALVNCKQLSIFGIGRALGRLSMVKHNIKCIDRLFGEKGSSIMLTIEDLYNLLQFLTSLRLSLQLFNHLRVYPIDMAHCP